MNPIVGNNFLDTRVGALMVAADLATPDLHLTKSALTIDRETTLAELDAIEADYSGYAVEVGAWSVVTISDDGKIEYQCIVPEFRPNATTITNNIFGWYMTKTGTGELLMAGSFEEAPIPMGSALNNLIITPRWRTETGGLTPVLT